jgi:hypothetical protein
VLLLLQIFTQSFVLSAQQKEKHWLEEYAQNADLTIDDYLQDEMIGASNTSASTKRSKEKKEQLENAANATGAQKKTDEKKKGKKNTRQGDNEEEQQENYEKKRKLQEMKKQLMQLLETPLPTMTTANPKVTSNPNDWRKRKNGFFVYNPSMNIN